MSSGETKNVRAASPSSASRSEHGDEEAVGDSAREEGRLTDNLRNVQVVSAPPRAGTSDEGETEGESSSSSEAEEQAEESANGPSRGKSYLQSIRARKPKKKVYAKPNSKR